VKPRTVAARAFTRVRSKNVRHLALWPAELAPVRWALAVNAMRRILAGLLTTFSAVVAFAAIESASGLHLVPASLFSPIRCWGRGHSGTKRLQDAEEIEFPPRCRSTEVSRHRPYREARV
jgi:hypothetical protein